MFNSFDVGISFEMDLVQDFCFRYDSRLIGDVGFYSAMLGHESCVDILMFSSKGLFVIEAKNYKTALRGCINDNFWLGVTGRNSTKVYNVYMQNLLHVRLVRQFLRRRKLNAPRIFNVVLVPDSCRVFSDYGGVMTVSNFHSQYVELQDVWPNYEDIFAVFDQYQLDYFKKRRRRNGQTSR